MKEVSQVWTIFVRHEDEQGDYAQCSLCEKIYRNTSKSGSTTSLWKHIEKQHPIEAAELEKLKNGRREANNQSISIQSLFTNRSYREALSEDSLAEAICLGKLPLEVFDCYYFANYIQTLNHNYQLPSRGQFLNEILPRTSKNLTDQLYEHLAGKTFALSVDSCPIPNTKSHLLGIACHYVDDDDRMIKKILGTVELSTDPTAELMANEIIKILNGQGVNMKNCLSITTPDTMEMVEMCDVIGIERIACFYEVLQSMVECLCESLNCSNSIEKCRQIVDLNDEESYFSIIANALAKQPEIFTCDELSLLKGLIKYLEVIDECRIQMSIRGSTLADYVALTRSLQQKIDSMSESATSSIDITVLNNLKRVMERKLPPIWNGELAQRAICLDPKYAFSSIYSDKEWNDMMKQTGEYIDSAQALSIALEEASTSPFPQQGLFGLLNSSRKRKIPTPNSDLQLYEELLRCSRPSDTFSSSLRFLRTHRASFPMLFDVAKISFCSSLIKFDCKELAEKAAKLRNQNKLTDKQLEHFLFVQASNSDRLFQSIQPECQNSASTSPAIKKELVDDNEKLVM